jgi:esterase/lipase superfamily enzyme
VKSSSVHEVSILANSMGNWLTLEALRQMAIRNGKLSSKFKDIMLSEPTFSSILLVEEINSMGPQPQLFMVFISSSSSWFTKTLDISDNGLKDQSQMNFSVVDLSNATSNDSVNHSKVAVYELSLSIGQLFATE